MKQPNLKMYAQARIFRCIHNSGDHPKSLYICTHQITWELQKRLSWNLMLGSGWY